MNTNNIYKKALKLAIPMMIQNGITNMVGLVDNVMVGSVGTEAMTAVSIIGQLLFVFYLAVFGGLSGPGIYGAQFYGQGNEEGFKNTFRVKWYIVMFCVIAGVLIFIFAGDQLIGLYLKGEASKVDPALTLKLAKEYLSLMLIQILPFGITQIYAGSLRETGSSVKPMVAGTVSVFVDIILNYILIYGHFGFPKLGVRGAAIATVFARFVEMGIVVIWAHARKDQHTFLKGIYKTIRIPGEFALKVIKKGIPIFFNEFLWAGGIAAITQNYSYRSLDIIAGINISNALCNLFNVVFIALGNSVGILVGQMLGAKEFKRAQKDSFKLMRFTGAVCIIVAAIIIAISGLFPKLYDTSQEIRDIGTMCIIVTAAFFPVQGFLNALYFTLRSGGKTFITFLFDSVFSWVVTVPISFILCKLTNVPVLWILIAVQSADIIKLIVGYVLIKKGVWITNVVEDM